VSTGPLTVTFAGCGDAFGSAGRFQACIHLRHRDLPAPVLLDCGATSLTALRQAGLDPAQIGAVLVSHLHGDHFGGLVFLILDAQFSGRAEPLAVAGPPGTGQRLAEAMECLFPGSTRVRRRFEVVVTELAPGERADIAGIGVQTAAARHPSGAPALILRLDVRGTVVAYTGDTSWTPAITTAAAGADLLIAEAYYWDKPVPHHLRHADLSEHAAALGARRTVLTHMSAGMASRHAGMSCHESAHDGLVLQV
jgi:ribonuclease BN (tRNA processing enzyme)